MLERPSTALATHAIVVFAAKPSQSAALGRATGTAADIRLGVDHDALFETFDLERANDPYCAFDGVPHLGYRASPARRKERIDAHNFGNRIAAFKVPDKPFGWHQNMRLPGLPTIRIRFAA